MGRVKDWKIEQEEKKEEKPDINTYDLQKAKRLKHIKMINHNPSKVSLYVVVDHTNEVQFIAEKKEE